MATTATQAVRAGGSPFADPGAPLVSLLSRLSTAYVTEFDRRLLDSEFCSLSLAHSYNVLRHLGAGPQRASRLVEFAGVTKQAISQQLVHLERDGYIRTKPDPDDQRARLVELTERGARAQEHVRRTFVEIEEAWAHTVGGAERMSDLRRELMSLIEAASERGSVAADDPTSC